MSENFLSSVPCLISQFEDRIAELERENAVLRLNPNFGTLTRPALEIEHRKLTGSHFLVMIDIDKLHELNSQYGSLEPVNAMIKRAFDFRDDDLLLKANYASGDEVVFIVRTDPAGFIDRLAESLAREGLSATMVFEAITEEDSLLEVCDRAIKRVYDLKAKRGVVR